MNTSVHIFSLSEKAITVELGNTISEETHYKVVSLQQFIQQLYIPGFTEAVPAYCSITVYYDPVEVLHKIPESSKGISIWMKNYLQAQLNNWQPQGFSSVQQRLVEIPVCYEEEYGIDLAAVADLHHTTKENIIQQHTANTYHVYMMGFSPGFPYLGILPDSLVTPRRSQPRIKVSAGSVAIAGNQTGIYPLESPGGWNIIGRTAIKLFEKEKENPFLLHTGDRVKFIAIDKKQFTVLAQS
ncbi:MAG: 5-oxoprolinase subunit PxpB [Sphingobacteriales bacterium]|nr:5-oxoprolinase subunit PxpB [Sphingobacteriales bacterium]